MVLVALLVIAAIIAVLVGTMLMTQATLGIGVIAIGIFLGVLARILQADSNHRKLAKLLEQRS